MLVDLCPCCEAKYEWDACNDYWKDTTELSYEPAGGRGETDDREVTVCVCPHCDAVVGIIVLAEAQCGRDVFTLSTRPL